MSLNHEIDRDRVTFLRSGEEHTALREFAEALDKIIADAQETRVSELEAESAQRMRALESLTPTGSEFVNDVEACVNYARTARTNLSELLKKAIKRAKGAEAENARLREALDKIIADAQETRVSELEAENARLREALGQIANPPEPSPFGGPEFYDKGQAIARAALSPQPEGGQS
jgi:cell shape-determining protein MreC